MDQDLYHRIKGLEYEITTNFWCSGQKINTNVLTFICEYRFFNQFFHHFILIIKKKNDPKVLLQAGNFSSKLAKQFQEDQFTKNKQF